MERNVGYSILEIHEFENAHRQVRKQGEGYRVVRIRGKEELLKNGMKETIQHPAVIYELHNTARKEGI